ncbi:MAG: hypothetical protein Q8N28_01380 [bacterium]|nr:hypothetical protein [bacterium]
MLSLKFIIGLLILILSFHILTTINHWYWTYPWLDIPMHFLGGFWVAMVFLYFWRSAHISIGAGRLSTPAVDTALRSRFADSNFVGDQARRTSESCRTKHGKIANSFILLILVLSFVALIGVFWEFYEFLYDVLISSRGYSGFARLGAADMIGDLFFDLLGGLTFLIICRIMNLNNNKTIQ